MVNLQNHLINYLADEGVIPYMADVNNKEGTYPFVLPEKPVDVHALRVYDGIKNTRIAPDLSLMGVQIQVRRQNRREAEREIMTLYEHIKILASDENNSIVLPNGSYVIFHLTTTPEELHVTKDDNKIWSLSFRVSVRL